MRKKIIKLLSVVMSVTMSISVFTGINFNVAFASQYNKTVTVANKIATKSVDDEVTTTAVNVSNQIGNITLEQKAVNYSELAVKVPEVNSILATNSADGVRITARMYYEDTVTQEVKKTVTLNQNVTEYSIDYENFGKFTTTVEYMKDGNVVSTSDDVTVGIVASEYNLAPISATFPAILFTLSLWDNTSSCITRNADGDPIPTMVVLERASSWNWSDLPANVYKLPTASASDFEGVRWGGASWLNARYKMASYIKDLYEISPNAKFHLYYTDNFVENVLLLMVANNIPEDSYNVIMLSDGGGTYFYFNSTYSSDTDGSKYEVMRSDWESLKEKTREEGKFDPNWASEAYRNDNDLYNTCLSRYAAVAAEDDNIDWWVARTSGTFNISNTTLQNKVIANCTVANVTNMLTSLQSAGKALEFKELYNLNDDMFSEADKTGKPVMLILGSRVTSETNFKNYAKLVMSYYGDSYVYYYKGHPGTPTNLYPSKQEELDELGITDVDSSIPAELILFFFPDIYMCGYSSTTYQSVESEEMACGLFNATKASAATNVTTEGCAGMMDFFVSPVSSTNTTYGELYIDDTHTYFLVEFNDTSSFDIAIYDATDDKFTYYKNTAEDDSYSWSSDVMANATISDIASVDYTGKKIKPDVTVTVGENELKNGTDYSISYSNNVLPGRGKVTIKGKGTYADLGSISKNFVINKIDNPIEVSCSDVAYGVKVSPKVVNPSTGDLSYEYKEKGAADDTYSTNVPTEPGAYTLSVTSEYTACYNSASKEVDFNIVKADPVINKLPIASGITYGQSLANSTLSGEEAAVSGNFTWKDITLKPLVSDSNSTKYNIVFTPEDTDHYNVIEQTVTLSVAKVALNGITVSPYQGTYDAKEHIAVTVAGVPSDAKVTYSKDGTNYYMYIPTVTNTGSTDIYVKVEGDNYLTYDAKVTAKVNDTISTEAGIATETPSVTNPAESTTPDAVEPDVANLAKGQKITVSGGVYQVKISSKDVVTLKYVKTVNKKKSSVTIPKNVKYDGKTYAVDEIGSSAFVGNKKITKIIIASNVKKIDTKAFFNCVNLKSITIKTTKVTFIGSKAFKNISKKAKFNLPSAKKKVYKKKIKAAGFKI